MNMMDSYNVLYIVVGVIGLYGISLLLVKMKRVTFLTHCRIWNVVLLLSFLVMAILGVLLAAMIDAKARISGYHNILWFHVEFGITMAIIGFFHVLWHIRYYTLIYKKFGGRCRIEK